MNNQEITINANTYNELVTLYEVTKEINPDNLQSILDAKGQADRMRRLGL